jgi:hypothetical protein
MDPGKFQYDHHPPSHAHVRRWSLDDLDPLPAHSIGPAIDTDETGLEERTGQGEGLGEDGDGCDGDVVGSMGQGEGYRTKSNERGVDQRGD